VTLHYNLEGGFARWAFRVPYTPQVLQFLSYGQWQLSKAELPPYTSSSVVHVTGSGLSIRKVRDAATGRNLRKELGVPEDTVVIGTAGAIRPRKRMEDFIRLIGHLKQRGLRVVGWIAGGGHSVEEAYKCKLDALIDQLGLHDVCRFVGFIYPCTDFYTALDIYVHTSNMEIFCMSLCEAQAMEIPSLAYDVGGNREAVPNDECIVPLGALDVLTSKVEALVRNKEFRLAAGRIARQFVEENLDAPIYAAKVRALYSKALQGRPVHV
jgi:glycosyltransferase involved in cell wall biosynthesis